jgi:hypothetical protein
MSQKDVENLDLRSSSDSKLLIYHAIFYDLYSDSWHI